MNDKPLIDPQNLPTWTAVGFGLTLLALVFSLVGIYRSNVLVLATQTEVFALNRKIQELSMPRPDATPAPAENAAGEVIEKAGE